MSAEENKALVRRYVESVWSGKNVDALDEFYAAEFTFNGEPYTAERFKKELRGYFAEVLDIHTQIEDITAEGEKVAYRWIMRGTIQATGKQEVHRGITFNRIANNKIVEDWYNSTSID